LPVVCNADPHNSESEEGHIVPKKTGSGRRGIFQRQGGDTLLMMFLLCNKESLNYFDF